MPWWIVVTFAFVCGFLMDVVWTLCVDAVTLRKASTAANFAPCFTSAPSSRRC